MKIREHTVEEFIKKVEDFHGYAAPGVVLGGFMVEMAYRHLPEQGLFDAIVETVKCLPDAVQLLTPCTIGNSWLKIIETGRFAITIYDKKTGDGVRVFVKSRALEKWPEIKTWIFKLKNKKEQDSQKLLQETLDAGTSILGFQHVSVDLAALRHEKSKVVICPECGEGYSAADGEVCPVCKGEKQYYVKSATPTIRTEKIALR